jgi:hypothetical protein
VEICSGGSPGCRLQRANIEQTRDQLAGAGLLTDQEIERFYRLIDDPAFSV